MSDSENHRINSALWLGAFLLMAAILSNALFFIKVPGQQVFPWINLLLGTAAAALCITALKRSMSNPELRRGKAAGWTLSILAVLLFAFSVLSFTVARKLPSPDKAPQVGQKAPDFTLRDTRGVPVTLAQLLSSPVPGSVEKPKSVLLIFYRGYW
jgi:uncharacterized BrkB/YihY/UPF0761 family membrane protein